MPAPKGNQFWKACTKFGRDKLFESPEELWKEACQYFQWVEDNPLYEDRLVTFQGEATHEPVAKMRAMTNDGLCLFLGIDTQTLANYGSKSGYEAYFGIVTRIKAIIRDQKFSGAAADLLNPNIIARDLGLADTKDLKSSDGSMTPKETVINAEISPQDAAAAYRELMQQDDNK